MKLMFDAKNKWSILPVFDFAFLQSEAPLVAAIAEHDITEAHRKEYKLVDGDMYCVDKSSSSSGYHRWWFFDYSVRRWSECDDPITNKK